MPVYYKASKVKSHLDPEKKERYYARPAKRQNIGLREISRRLAMRSTASPGDVALVLNDLRDLLLELLGENYNVHIDGFGIFSLTFKSDTADSPEEITYNSVKEIRLQFLPDKEMKQELKTIKVRKVGG